MKKVCYFECFAGASGDMLLGALLDTGVDADWFLQELDKLTEIKNRFEVKISRILKKGISATNVDVIAGHEHHHRGLREITDIINSSQIDNKAKLLALKIFTNLAIAEAKVHDTDINKIHFHEVGAIDSIVDIVGFSILFTKLDINKVIVSPVNTGTGFVKCAHGTLPVPAPATLEIINSAKWPVNNSTVIESEALTPTGAAILTTIKDEYGQFPSFNSVESIAYGSGNKDFSAIANVIRLTIGTIQEDENKNEQVTVLETNIDDMQPEFYEYLTEKLLNNGALDVFLNPIIMKKSRPAVLLNAICEDKDVSKLEKIIFEETTTLGIRKYKTQRTLLSRKIQLVDLENLGEVSVKISKDSEGNILTAKPEFEDCKNIAEKHNLPLKKVYEMVLSRLQA